MIKEMNKDLIISEYKTKRLGRAMLIENTVSVMPTTQNITKIGRYLVANQLISGGYVNHDIISGLKLSIRSFFFFRNRIFRVPV